MLAMENRSLLIPGAFDAYGGLLAELNRDF